MLEVLDIKPEEAVFIDDKQIHVDSAKQVGLEGVLFINNIKLVDDLRRVGVEV